MQASRWRFISRKFFNAREFFGGESWSASHFIETYTDNYARQANRKHACGSASRKLTIQ